MPTDSGAWWPPSRPCRPAPRPLRSSRPRSSRCESPSWPCSQQPRWSHRGQDPRSWLTRFYHRKTDEPFSALLTLQKTHRVTTDRRKELCVQLLRGVHVESFAEFFQLTSADLDGQGLATNDSVMELLQHNLSKWEDAIQARDYDTAVGARQRLAEIFSQRNSPRNAVHHSRQALATAKLSRRPPLLAEAYAELGSQLRDMGEGQEARELLTSMLRLAEQHSLGGDHGVAAACNHLAQTYVQLAAQVGEDFGFAGAWKESCGRLSGISPTHCSVFAVSWHLMIFSLTPHVDEQCGRAEPTTGGRNSGQAERKSTMPPLGHIEPGAGA